MNTAARWKGTARAIHGIFHAVRAVWPVEKPIRREFPPTIGWIDGIEPRDAVEIAGLRRRPAVDIGDVSAGHTSIAARRSTAVMFQTPFEPHRTAPARRPMAVGKIFEAVRRQLDPTGRPRRPVCRHGRIRRSVLDLHAAASWRPAAKPRPLPYDAAAIKLYRFPAVLNLCQRGTTISVSGNTHSSPAAAAASARPSRSPGGRRCEPSRFADGVRNRWKKRRPPTRNFRDRRRRD